MANTTAQTTDDIINSLLGSSDPVTAAVGQSLSALRTTAPTVSNTANPLGALLGGLFAEPAQQNTNALDGLVNALFAAREAAVFVNPLALSSLSANIENFSVDDFLALSITMRSFLLAQNDFAFLTGIISDQNVLANINPVTLTILQGLEGGLITAYVAALDLAAALVGDTTGTALLFAAVAANSPELLVAADTGDGDGEGEGTPPVDDDDEEPLDDGLDGEFEGGDGADSVSGGDSDDSLSGGGGNDTLSGGNGDDTIEGGGGKDELNGGGGKDELSGGGGADKIKGGGGNDVIKGGGGKDEIEGGGGRDQIEGNGGKDQIKGGGGKDEIDGGGGKDTVEGGGGKDMLQGGGGRDFVSGGGGKDTVDGGRGKDDLEGGGGRDTFLFHTGDRGDIVHDFQIGKDSLAVMMSADFEGDGGILEMVIGPFRGEHSHFTLRTADGKTTSFTLQDVTPDQLDGIKIDVFEDPPELGDGDSVL